MNVRRLNAGYILRDYYAEVVCFAIHPANLGALPPSLKELGYQAHKHGLLDSKHAWILGFL